MGLRKSNKLHYRNKRCDIDIDIIDFCLSKERTPPEGNITVQEGIYKGKT